MTITVQATYENGVLKPAQPLPLNEREQVQVTNGTRIRINVLRINDLRSTLTSIRFIELYINNTE